MAIYTRTDEPTQSVHAWVIALYTLVVDTLSTPVSHCRSSNDGLSCLVSTYIVCERLSVMQRQAGVVGNLVKKSQFTLFLDLVPSLPPSPPPENWNLGRSWHKTYVETNICIPRIPSSRGLYSQQAGLMQDRLSFHMVPDAVDTCGVQKG